MTDNNTTIVIAIIAAIPGTMAACASIYGAVISRRNTAHIHAVKEAVGVVEKQTNGMTESLVNAVEKRGEVEKAAARAEGIEIGKKMTQKLNPHK